MAFSSSNFSKVLHKPDSLNEEIKDSWFSRDKGQHLTGSFISTGLIMMSSNRFLNTDKGKSKTVAVSFTLSLGLGKEIFDSQQHNNHFSYKDLTADLLGICLAILVFK
jgi:uncharacterized protein YfiM (DUF2279 family)